MFGPGLFAESRCFFLGGFGGYVVFQQKCKSKMWVGGWVLARMDRPCRKLFRSPFLLLFLVSKLGVQKASPGSTFYFF